jgi:hypothetical protein
MLLGPMIFFSQRKQLSPEGKWGGVGVGATQLPVIHT